ncbi:N-acetylglucosamine kinase [Actinoplanes sp. N902-109]|uniref:N-acetylglucosamine kinase n=1 Tax=Actinoplanes sp. (strain N902-109) TaxID=649831 RepID=UPI0003295E41|nr:BadF/BadG/BcrA/BcrD ATPase family protein [Actinoplanes sp. N902-109]AGL20095.1 ATPase BadF/BadG/BcrA/BcrD type [Actinoplanes sp. N902-109]
MLLVVGVDAGGTGSRAVLARSDGTVVGRGCAGPGNLFTPHGPTSIGTAIRAALGNHDPALVAAAVVGAAGVSALGSHPEFRSSLGLSCPVDVVGDAVTAFAAGVSDPGGAVLIAGTGAVAARIENWQVGRTADGLGLLLGDEGSGAWLGLQAVRAAARAFGSDDSLVAAVIAHTGARSCDDLVRWAGRQPPSAFAALAPLVCGSGDGAAVQILGEAVTRLVATLTELGPPDGPVVLAGGLLTRPTPVRHGVLAALPGVPLSTSRDPAVGAAWLALRRTLDLDRDAAARLHRVMLAPPRP